MNRHWDIMRHSVTTAAKVRACQISLNVQKFMGMLYAAEPIREDEP